MKEKMGKLTVLSSPALSPAFGFFNAYGNTVRKDSVDYVVHLGDYIYEYANGKYGWGNSLGRISLPDKEIYSLYDYRKRIATYRTDLDLLASHQQFAWIPVWDDHGKKPILPSLFFPFFPGTKLLISFSC
jgi:alkaline phosphatase D